MKKLKVPHSEPGMGLFAAKILEKGDFLSYHYGSLIYADLNRQQYKTKVYGEGVMEVTAETVRKCSTRIPDKASDRMRLSTFSGLFLRCSVRCSIRMM